MKIIIIEKNVELVKNKIIPKLLEYFSAFKTKYSIADDLTFEFIEGNVPYYDNGMNFLLYDEQLIERLKNEYDKDQNIRVIMDTIVSKQGIQSCFENHYCQDDLAKKITYTYINLIPIFYITDDASFYTRCISRFGLDLSHQYLPKKFFSDNYTELLDEIVEKMFLYFITNDKNKLRETIVSNNVFVKKKIIK